MLPEFPGQGPMRYGLIQKTGLRNNFLEVKKLPGSWTGGRASKTAPQSLSQGPYRKIREETQF